MTDREKRCMCMARMRAEDKGLPLDAFPPRVRSRHGESKRIKPSQRKLHPMAGQPSHEELPPSAEVHGDALERLALI